MMATASLFHSLTTHARYVTLLNTRHTTKTRSNVLWQQLGPRTLSSVCLHCISMHNKMSRSYSTQRDKKQVEMQYSRISVKELAKKMGVGNHSVLDIVNFLEYDVQKGVDTMLDRDIVELIAEEFDFTIVTPAEEEKVEDEVTVLAPTHIVRPPVVTIMGHVDHGKTTLLDYLRKTNIVEQEAGAITQSIGAFSVQVPDLTKSKEEIPETITFVDTPGHAAFNKMRARGARLTDMVVLIVAADDGIENQTKECLKHIRESKVPYIIAVNKIDAHDAKPQRVREQFMELGIQYEDFGGTTKCVEISALKGTNVDKLLLLLNKFAKQNKVQASLEMLCEAVVLEVEKDIYNGKSASVIIQNGVLCIGDMLVVPGTTATCSVRAIINEWNESVGIAMPSDPVQVVGWKELPRPGDIVRQVEDKSTAQSLSQKVKSENKRQKNKQRKEEKRKLHEKLLYKEKDPTKFKIDARGQLKSLFREDRRTYRKMGRDNVSALASKAHNSNKKPEVNIVLKCDVSGSLEALINTLGTYYSSKLDYNILVADVGPVTESDVATADTADCPIFVFNMDVSSDALADADHMGVDIYQYTVIYELLDDVKQIIDAMHPPIITEGVYGRALVQKIFKASGKSKAAGCHVTSGTLHKDKPDALWRVFREGEKIFEGQMKSLRRGANEIKAANQLTECGIGLVNFNDFKEGDEIVNVEIIKTPVVWEWPVYDFDFENT